MDTGKHYAMLDTIRNTLKPYLFKTGSYWKYQLQGTSVIRTVTLLNQTFKYDTFYDYGMNVYFIHQNYFAKYFDDYDNKNYWDYSSTGYALYRSEIDSVHVGQFVYANPYYASTPPSVRIVRDTVFSQLTISAITYSNVERYRFTASEIYFPHLSSDVFMYWAANTGIIRYEFVDSLNTPLQLWDLTQANPIKLYN